MENAIYLSPPDIGENEATAILRAIRSGWVAPLGPEVDAFEAEVAEYVGANYAVALVSGTAALHLALLASGTNAGDAVITSTMTFVATANAISYIGAEPVFVDSTADGTLDPTLLEQAIRGVMEKGQKVSAVVPVDLYGHLADYTRIIPILNEYGVPLIPDAAEALGGSHSGSRAGSIGEASILSFNGNKIITTSGGGMYLTPSKEKAEFVRYLATQARQDVPHYEHHDVGFNYRMSNLLAALGRAQLQRLPSIIERRRAIRETYRNFFEEVDGVSLLSDNPEEDNFWLTAVRIDKGQAHWKPLELHAYLSERKIESRPLWKPMHLQPVYRRCSFVGGNVAEQLFESGLVLPSGSAMSDSDLDRVLETISAFFQSR